MATVTDQIIRSRRVSYLCCHGEYIWKAIVAMRFGDETCYRENLRKAKWVAWALGVMLRTPLSTEAADCRCVGADFACQVIQKTDPLCVTCGCGCVSTADECDISVNYRVIGTLDLPADLPGSPTLNDAYLVISIPSSVYRWNGTTWVITAVADGQVVQDDAGILYTAYLGQFGRYWPPFNVFTLGGGDFLLLDQYQWVNAAHATRTVVVEITLDGITWVSIYSGLVFGANGLIFTPGGTPLATRVTYTEGNCTYGPFAGIVSDDPEPAAHDIGTSHDFAHG